jgi:hypothetical protein
MKPQSYKTHRRFVPMFHFFLLTLITITLIGAFVNFFSSLGNPDRLYSASLVLTIAIILVFMFFFMRIFALKAQDRAIRAEENLRHFAFSGKLLDKRLRIRQVTALRFAPDEEFVELAYEAAEKDMKPDEIKHTIRQWKADHYRV